VIGQQLQEVSIRDLLREALFETAPYSAQKQLDSLFATQRLRAAVEKQRKQASSLATLPNGWDNSTARLKSSGSTNCCRPMCKTLLKKALPRLGFEIEGDLNQCARLNRSSGSSWIEPLASHWRGGLPPYISVRRDGRREVTPRPLPSCVLASLCSMPSVTKLSAGLATKHDAGDSFLIRRRKILIMPPCMSANWRTVVARWRCETTPVGTPIDGTALDSTGEFTACAPNHLIALVGAPPSLAWKAVRCWNLRRAGPTAPIRTPYAGETTFLQQTRTAVRAESSSRLDDFAARV